MGHRLIIVEDHEDVFENLERKIPLHISDMTIKTAHTCDEGYDTIKQNIQENSFDILILDLTFTGYRSNSVLKHGRDLLSVLKKEKIIIPTIIYSSHASMEQIYPVIQNYEPNGYVIKSSTSTDELILAIKKVTKGKTHFSEEVSALQMKRALFYLKIDEVDLQIINFLPEASSMEDWKDRIYKKDVPLSYKSIKKRIDSLCDKFEVENEKLLLLKLQKLAIL